jgi:hypothetical protein
MIRISRRKARKYGPAVVFFPPARLLAFYGWYLSW